MSDKSIEEEIKLKAQKSRKLARYMSSTQIWWKIRFARPWKMESLIIWPVPAGPAL